MIRVATLLAAGIGALVAALFFDRQLDQAVEREPPWVTVRIENKLEVSVRLLNLVVSHGDLQGPEPAWPLFLASAPPSGPVPVAGRYRLDRTQTTVELRLWRLGAAAPDVHALPIEAREGGVCHLVVELLPEGVRGSECSDWTPTYRGWPH